MGVHVIRRRRAWWSLENAVLDSFPLPEDEVSHRPSRLAGARSLTSVGILAHLTLSL